MQFTKTDRQTAFEHSLAREAMALVRGYIDAECRDLRERDISEEGIAAVRWELTRSFASPRVIRKLVQRGGVQTLRERIRQAVIEHRQALIEDAVDQAYLDFYIDVSGAIGWIWRNRALDEHGIPYVKTCVSCAHYHLDGPSERPSGLLFFCTQDDPAGLICEQFEQYHLWPLLWKYSRMTREVQRGARG